MNLKTAYKGPGHDRLSEFPPISKEMAPKPPKIEIFEKLKRLKQALNVDHLRP